MTGSTSRRLRILVIGPGPASKVSRGGMATVVSEMLRIADSPEPPVEFTVIPTYLDYGRTRKTLVGLIGMIRAAGWLAAGRADLLHVHLSHGGSIVRKSLPLAVARWRGVPVVLHAHSYNFAEWYRGLPRVVQALVRRALRADQWLVLGTALAAEYTAVLRLEPDRVEVLHNPAPPVATTVTDPSGPLIGVALGRLGERKGTYDIIDAVAMLDPTVRAQIRVVLAGDGDNDRARSAAADLECVEIRDWVGPAERDALLANASFLLLPSYDEGLPMALLEAMSAGLVPVVSPVGAISDVVTDERNGIIVAPGDAARIAAAITTLVVDAAMRERLSTAAMATAEALGIDVWHQRLMTIWTNLTAPAGSGDASPDIMKIGETPVARLTEAQTLDRIRPRSESATATPLAIGSINLDHLHHFRPDGTGVGSGSVEWLWLADGAPVARRGAALAGREWPRVTGADLLPATVALCETRGWRLGVVGGTAETHTLLRSHLAEAHPALDVAGLWSPERSVIDDPDGSAALTAAIADARVDVLVVGLGKPRQEKWIDQWGAETGAGTLLAFGAATDFLAGVVDRAPQHWQDADLEWLFRLKQEPRRLARRYVLQGPGALLRLHRTSRLD